jgi:hypothetical protein
VIRATMSADGAGEALLRVGDVISRKASRYPKTDQEDPTDIAFSYKKASIAPQVIASKASGKRIAAVGHNAK